MRKLLLLTTLLSTPTFATTTVCLGTANDGVAHVVMDGRTDMLLVNGYSYPFEARTKDKKGICTETYTNIYHERVYLCIYKKNYETFYRLRRVNETEKSVDLDIELSCHEEA